MTTKETTNISNKLMYFIVFKAFKIVKYFTIYVFFQYRQLDYLHLLQINFYGG